MKAMISQPMAGKTDNEITETRDRACAMRPISAKAGRTRAGVALNTISL
jgi:hypothetical protein